MAAVQERNESFRVLFRYQGKRYALNLGKVPREAEAFFGSVDLNLLRDQAESASAAAGRKHHQLSEKWGQGGEHLAARVEEGLVPSVQGAGPRNAQQRFDGGELPPEGANAPGSR